MRFIDISKWNKLNSNDYDVLAKSYDGVIMRIGFTGWGKPAKNKQIDELYEQHDRELRKRGVLLGVYWYGTDESVAEAREAGRKCLEFAKGRDYPLGVFYDTEDGYYQTHMSKDNLTDTVLGFTDYIKNNSKYLVGVYASSYWFKDKLHFNRLKDLIIWEAHYGRDNGKIDSKPMHKPHIHQFTSKYMINGKMFDNNEVYDKYWRKDNMAMTFGTSKVSKHFMGENVVITSDIWDRDKDYPKQFLPHVGYDYRAKIGTPLYAPFTGEIVQVTPDLGSSYGRQVYVYDGQHTFHTAHLSKVEVKAGQKVKKGDKIGLSGASGSKENTYAPHLHAGLAKGLITNAGNKGSYLGDLWVDLEEFNFEIPTVKVGDKVKTNATRDGNGVKLDGRRINPKREFTVHQVSKNGLEVLLKEVSTWVFVNTLIEHEEKVETKPVPRPEVKPSVKKYITLKGRVPLYDDNSEPYGAPNTVTREVEVIRETADWYLVSHSKFRPNQVWVKKSDLIQYANMSGQTWLFVNKNGDNTYPVPSVNKTTGLISRSAVILEEGNGRVKVDIPKFSPSTVWVANSQITKTATPVYPIR